MEGLVTGCIPVTVMDGQYMFSEDAIPYEEFTVRLRYEDIDQLPAVLRSISKEEIRNLQARFVIGSSFSSSSSVSSLFVA